MARSTEGKGKGKEALSKLTEGAKKGLEWAREEAGDLAATTKLKLEVREVYGRRDEAFNKLGRQVFAMHSEGRAMPEVKALCQEIAGLDKEVKRLEAEIERVQTED